MAQVAHPHSHGLQLATPFAYYHRHASSHANSRGEEELKKCARKCTRSKNSRRWQISCNSIAASSAVEKPILNAESNLIDALIGIQGRGRGVSPGKLQNISEAVRLLEAIGGIDEPTNSSLVEGTWRLMFTTRPGTASPIQRAFVGVDTFTVFQEIILRGTDDPRVCNIVRFSEAIGELKVEAAASIATGRRIMFRFDKAAFFFKFLPFEVPYPVPFRLLGDEAKGWLETTYLSPSGNIRISKGNKMAAGIQCRALLLCFKRRLIHGNACYKQSHPEEMLERLLKSLYLQTQQKTLQIYNIFQENGGYCGVHRQLMQTGCKKPRQVFPVGR